MNGPEFYIEQIARRDRGSEQWQIGMDNAVRYLLRREAEREATPPVPPGPCMDRTPWEGIGSAFCNLRAGHAGGHESDSATWREATPPSAAPVDDEPGWCSGGLPEPPDGLPHDCGGCGLQGCVDPPHARVQDEAAAEALREAIAEAIWPCMGDAAEPGAGWPGSVGIYEVVDRVLAALDRGTR